MKVRIRILCLAAGLVGMLLLAACSPQESQELQELESVPGAFTFTEGESAYVDLYLRAVEHLENNGFGEAEAIYREIISLEPENANGYIGLGTSLQLQERYEEAQQAYSEALNIAPYSVEALIGVGSTYYGLADYPKAFELYSQAVALDGQNPNARWGIAITLEMLDRKAEAREHLEKIIELFPKSDLARDAEDMLADLR